MIRYILFIILLTLSAFSPHCSKLLATPQDNSSNQNYITTITPRVATSDVSNLSSTQALRTVQYFDGLGRPTQTVQVGAAPSGADIVSAQGYDAFGRPNKEWLPVPISNNNGNYVSNFTSRSLTYYSNDANPYKETKYESSPLNRIVCQLGAGEAWHNLDKGVVTDHLTNDQTTPLKAYYYYMNSNGDLAKSNTYATGELYVTKITDEDGQEVYEFTDKLGQKIVQRRRMNNQNVDTYLVYDDFGNLRYVLPPLAVDALTANGSYAITSDATLQKYAYFYRYDMRNRCIEKKLPGVEPVYMIYDRSDRLVLQQTGNQRLGSLWTVYKYDTFGRTLYSAEIQIGGSHDYWMSLFKDWLTIEHFTTDPQDYPMGDTGYSRGFFHNTPTRLLEVNYYDNYEFLNMLPTQDREHLTYQAVANYGAQYTNSTGLLTGKRVYLLNDPSRYIVSAYYYDDKANVVQERSNNIAPGYDATYYAYDFVGNVIKKHTNHTIEDDLNGHEYDELYQYTYDHANRPKQTIRDFYPPIVLSDNEYDELGRLSTKHRNNGDELSLYTYDIRNRPTRIQTGDFTQRIYYERNPQNRAPCFNGNISAFSWTYGNQTNSYRYAYDGLNRLTNAYYYTGDVDSYEMEYDETLQYDKHGNIVYLARESARCAGFDALDFTYNGNQVISILDNEGSRYSYTMPEYKGTYGVAGTFTYDSNGNRITDSDSEIVASRFNLLNLPDTIQFRNGNQIVNTYSADGRRLRTDYFTPHTPIVVPLSTIKRWDDGVGSSYDQDAELFIGNFHYRANWGGADGAYYDLEKIYTPEGYYDIPTLEHVYYRKDYLGNNREVWSANLNRSIQRMQYYPSGLAWYDSQSPNRQQRKYGGKEFMSMHGYDRYDFLGRMYYPAIMGFDSPDPLAEKYYGWSPYAYCMNNPVRYVDPDGKAVGTIIGTIIGGVSGAYNAHKNGTDVWAGATEGAVAGAITGATVDLAIAATAATGGGALAVIAVGATAGAVGGAAGAVAGDVAGQVITNLNKDSNIGDAITKVSADNFASKAIDGAISGTVSGVTGGVIGTVGKAAGASTQAVQQTMSKSISSTATNLTSQGASQGTVNAATSSITKGMGKVGTNTTNSMIKMEATATTITETSWKIIEDEKFK